MKILLSLLALVALSVEADECSMNTPEQTLECYDEYTRAKDVDSLKTIYWELKSFHFSDKVREESAYKVIERKVYEKDLELGGALSEVPLWAKKGNVELISEKSTNGAKNTYSHIFRKINDKWYMVGHSAHGVDDFDEDW